MPVQLKQLKIENFKNYAIAELEFSAGFNCFTGLNGAGKTNLLDAIYYLCSGKSYFNSTDSQLIKDTENYFSLRGSFDIGSRIDDVACVLVKGRKKVIKRNDAPYERVIDHYGNFPAIIIAPGDLYLVTGGSEERRKWLDSVISLIDRDYLYQLIRYEKVLEQRNAELKKMSAEKSENRHLLDIYDKMMDPLATSIYQRRIAFMADFMPVFTHYYSEIAGEGENPGFQYLSYLHSSPLLDLLDMHFKKDLLLQRTNYGTHKDDLDFTLNGNPLKRFGSQGQQKTFVFALKLAQRQYIAKHKGEKPLLLLDDICERLDEHRIRKLIFIIIAEGEGQVFITDTNEERLRQHLPRGIDAKFFYIANGEVANL